MHNNRPVRGICWFRCYWTPKLWTVISRIYTLAKLDWGFAIENALDASDPSAQHPVPFASFIRYEKRHSCGVCLARFICSIESSAGLRADYSPCYVISIWPIYETPEHQHHPLKSQPSTLPRLSNAPLPTLIRPTMPPSNTIDASQTTRSRLR